MTDASNRKGVIVDGLGLSNPLNLTIRSLHSKIEISKIICGPESFGLTSVIPSTDMFALGVYLTELPHLEILKRGRPVVRQGYRANAIQLVDLADEYSANISHPHDVVAFSIPYPVLHEVADEAGEKRISTLACEPGIIDPVIMHLTASLLPAFGRSNEAGALFLEYVGLALCVHLLRTYGVGGGLRSTKGSLAPFQLKRAKELIAAHFADDISLADIARECGLSRQHFIRAFKAATGVPPHRWLQQYRVQVARSLLNETSLPIADIAVKCGFADQSHLTRVFAALIGETPAAWRRRNRAISPIDDRVLTE